jgi:hypothetical protein
MKYTHGGQHGHFNRAAKSSRAINSGRGSRIGDEGGKDSTSWTRDAMWVLLGEKGRI